MSLETLLAIKRLARHEASAEAALKLLAAAQRNLADYSGDTVSDAALGECVRQAKALRGNLSEEGLRHWVAFFLGLCRDQVSIMSGLFDLEGRRRRIEALLVLRTAHLGRRGLRCRSMGCSFCCRIFIRRRRFERLVREAIRKAATQNFIQFGRQLREPGGAEISEADLETELKAVRAELREAGARRP